MIPPAVIAEYVRRLQTKTPQCVAYAMGGVPVSETYSDHENAPLMAVFFVPGRLVEKVSELLRKEMGMVVEIERVKVVLSPSRTGP